MVRVENCDLRRGRPKVVSSVPVSGGFQVTTMPTESVEAATTESGAPGAKISPNADREDGFSPFSEVVGTDSLWYNI